jgi:transcriptional regulator with XRE-family HTH domain
MTSPEELSYIRAFPLGSDLMAGPTVSRRLLGIELRQLRETAGYSRKRVAAFIKTSESRLVQIELGRNVISYAELVMLLRDHYRVPERLAELEGLRDEAAKRTWFGVYGLREYLATYVGLEDGASSLRTSDQESIPGLLQTEGYMRRLFTADSRLTSTDIEKQISTRLRRQDRLTGSSPLQLTALISEGALLRCDEDIAADQLSHLIEAAQRPNVELLILPFRRGLHVGLAGSFSLLSFPELPDLAYQEYIVGGHMIDDPKVITELATIFDELRGQALGPNESLAMIAQLVNP